TALMPNPGAIATARLVYRPIAIDMMPAMRQVTVATCVTSRPLPPMLSVAGYTAMIYDITMNVVRPAMISVWTFVPNLDSLNCRSSQPLAAFADILTPNSPGENMRKNTPVVLTRP